MRTFHDQSSRVGRRKAAFIARVTTPNDDATKCPIPYCGRPTQARAGQGASPYLCRYHVQWTNRHGCPWLSTIPAAELTPYRRASERFIKTHASDQWIEAALTALRFLLEDAGPMERITDVLENFTPPQKARAAISRLRDREVPAERLLALHLAVSAAVKEAPIGPGSYYEEYRKVQIAKAVHRQAGDHMITGLRRQASGQLGKSYTKYLRSSGQMLRHLGEILDRRCETAAGHHLDEIIALRNELFGPRTKHAMAGRVVSSR